MSLNSSFYSYLMHSRTKGSRNGISTTPGYKAVGELAKGVLRNGRYIYTNIKKGIFSGIDKTRNATNNLQKIYQTEANKFKSNPVKTSYNTVKEIGDTYKKGKSAANAFIKIARDPKKAVTDAAISGAVKGTAAAAEAFKRSKGPEIIKNELKRIKDSGGLRQLKIEQIDRSNPSFNEDEYKRLLEIRAELPNEIAVTDDPFRPFDMSLDETSEYGRKKKEFKKKYGSEEHPLSEPVSSKPLIPETINGAIKSKYGIDVNQLKQQHDEINALKKDYDKALMEESKTWQDEILRGRTPDQRNQDLKDRDAFMKLREEEYKKTGYFDPDRDIIFNDEVWKDDSPENASKLYEYMRKNDENLARERKAWAKGYDSWDAMVKGRERSYLYTGWDDDLEEDPKQKAVDNKEKSIYENKARQEERKYRKKKEEEAFSNSSVVNELESEEMKYGILHRDKFFNDKEAKFRKENYDEKYAKELKEKADKEVEEYIAKNKDTPGKTFIEKMLGTRILGSSRQSMISKIEQAEASSPSYQELKKYNKDYDNKLQKASEKWRKEWNREEQIGGFVSFKENRMYDLIKEANKNLSTYELEFFYDEAQDNFAKNKGYKNYNELLSDYRKAWEQGYDDPDDMKHKRKSKVFMAAQKNKELEDRNYFKDEES